jgi:NADH kinase
MRDNQGMGSFEIYVNDILLTTMLGDGVLISTPTGSTAYNLSCGGSIVHIAAQVICLTPICPHSLSFRPIILPADKCHIKIRLSKDSRQNKAKITVDG